MIDSLLANVERARAGAALSTRGLERGSFGLVTLHRPSNVDEPQKLRNLLQVLAALAPKLPLLFPVHPRTSARIETLGISLGALREAGLVLTPPLGYLEFLQLQEAAAVVITDSGGVQEETTALGVPCLTVRDNTERPITVSQGTNKVVGSDPAVLPNEVAKVLAAPRKTAARPELWDGKAGQRAALAVRAFLTLVS
jgi:UDP-N-acetylglucosamine 2-epimerase (non-hydrolysing)